MARFELKSFREGKSDYKDRGLAGSFWIGKNLDIHGTEDVLTCNQALIADGNADAIVIDLILWGINGSDGNFYGFGDSGKIYKRTSSAVWSVVYTDAGGRITGAYEWYCDNGKRYMFWATATTLHAKEMPGNTGWSDVDATITPLSAVPQTYPKSDLTSSTWHSMTQSNGDLLICNDKLLAMVGYDGSYTKQAATLRPGTIATSIIEKGNVALIGGGDGQRQSWLLTWSQTGTSISPDAPSWIDKNMIPSPSINAIVQSELLLMSAGTNELYFSDMTNNLPICTMDGKANPGGVIEKGGLALFGLYGGSYPGIWSYGRVRKNESHVLNLEQYLDATEIGAVWKISEQVFISYQKGATHAVRKVDTATKAVAEYYSLTLTAPREAVWQSVDTITNAIPAGCSIAIYYDMDNTGSWTQAKMSGDVATATAGQRDPFFLMGSNGRDINLKVVLTPSGNLTPSISNLYVNFD